MTRGIGSVRPRLFVPSSRRGRWRASGRGMTKKQLENLLRKAGDLARDWDFFLIGSQALRGVCTAVPRDFPKTREADLYPRQHPQAWAIFRMAWEGAPRFSKETATTPNATNRSPPT